jgi:hypothetical protein
MAYSVSRIRLALVHGSHELMLDIVSHETPKAWRATHWIIDVCVTDTAGVPLDLTAIASLTLEIKSGGRLGTVLISQTKAAEDITATLSQANWEAGTAQHASFLCVNTDTAFNLAGADAASFHLVVKALTVSSPGQLDCNGITTLLVEEAGVVASNSPAANDPTYYTATESDARFTQAITVAYGLTISGDLIPTIGMPQGTTDGQTLSWDNTNHIWVASTLPSWGVLNTDTGKHHLVTCSTAGGLHLDVATDPLD